MTQGEILIQYGWLIALIVAVGVVSWVVILLQAVFHDKRIALVGVFGSLLVAFVAVFPELVPFALFFKVTAAVISSVFLLWFLMTHYKKPYVFLPIIGLGFSLGTGYWLYQMYHFTV